MPPQWVANRTPRAHHVNASIGVRVVCKTCYLRAGAAVDGGFDRIIVHGFNTVRNVVVDSI
eukprot:10266415-Lingulodinium_polyedra.AAC.1